MSRRAVIGSSGTLSDRTSVSYPAEGEGTRRRGARVGVDRRVVGLRLTVALATALVWGLPTSGRAQSFLKFSLSAPIDATAAPYLVALDQGHLAAEGLDVTIDPAAGAQEALSRVASGVYDLGVVDVNALIRYRDQNPSALMPAVFMVFNRPPFAVLARRSRGIISPKTLEGKRIGASLADNSLAYLRLFARVNDIDPARLTLESVALQVREPMLASGQIDAISSSTLAFVDLADRGVPIDDIVRLVMADYGVRLYGDAVFVNPRLVAERPDALRGFLRGLLKGLEDTIRDPSSAIGSVVSRGATRRPALELARLRSTVRENLLTPEVVANGYGAVDPERLAQAIDQLAMVFEFQAKPSAAAVFDPRFLPAREERLPFSPRRDWTGR